MTGDRYIFFGGFLIFFIFVCDDVASFVNLSVDVSFVVVTSLALDGVCTLFSCVYHIYSLVDIVA